MCNSSFLQLFCNFPFANILLRTSVINTNNRSSKAESYWKQHNKVVQLEYHLSTVETKPEQILLKLDLHEIH